MTLSTTRQTRWGGDPGPTNIVLPTNPEIRCIATSQALATVLLWMNLEKIGLEIIRIDRSIFNDGLKQTRKPKSSVHMFLSREHEQIEEYHFPLNQHVLNIVIEGD